MPNVATTPKGRGRYSDWFAEPESEFEDDQAGSWKVWQTADAGLGMRFLRLANDLNVVIWAPQRSDREVAERFAELTATWKRETRRTSSLQAKSLHPAYQEIIGLGPQVVPHIIGALRERPDHWFWALRSIVGSDRAEGATTLADAADRWIAWYNDRA